MTKAVISTSSPLPHDAAKNPHGHVARPRISESQLSPAARCRFCPFTRFRLGRPDQPSRRRRLLAREPCRGRCAHTRIPAPALCRAPPSRPVPAAACRAARRHLREARQGPAARVPVSSALLSTHANRRYPCPRLVGTCTHTRPRGPRTYPARRPPAGRPAPGRGYRACTEDRLARARRTGTGPRGCSRACCKRGREGKGPSRACSCLVPRERERGGGRGSERGGEGAREGA